MKKTQIYLQRQTAHRVISVVRGDLDELSKSAVDGVVTVKVEKIDKMAGAVKNALVSLVGT